MSKSCLDIKLESDSGSMVASVHYTEGRSPGDSSVLSMHSRLANICLTKSKAGIFYHTSKLRICHLAEVQPTKVQRARDLDHGFVNGGDPLCPAARHDQN